MIIIKKLAKLEQKATFLEINKVDKMKILINNNCSNSSSSNNNNIKNKNKCNNNNCKSRIILPVPMKTMIKKFVNLKKKNNILFLKFLNIYINNKNLNQIFF